MLINIAERVLPELIADWMNTKRGQNNNITFVQKRWAPMLINWVIECSTRSMAYRRTFRNATHLAWAIWDLRNHHMIWIIPNPDSLKRMTLLLESIHKISLQARTGYVRISEWGQHCVNHGMPCLVHILDTLRRIRNQPNQNQGAVIRCTANDFSNTTNHEILQPGMQITWKIGHISFVGCTNDWHNHHYSRKLFLRIPPPVPSVHLAVFSATFSVSQVHQFQIEVRLNWEMCQRNWIAFKISM